MLEKKLTPSNVTNDDENKSVHLSLGAALMGMGENLRLNKAAKKVADYIGLISVKFGKTKCNSFDMKIHLANDYLRQI